MSSCTTIAVKTGHSYIPAACISSSVECDPTTQFMCADQSQCVDIRFRCEADPYPDCAEGSDELNCNTTGKTVSAVVWELALQCWAWDRCIHYIRSMCGVLCNECRQPQQPLGMCLIHCPTTSEFGRRS